MWISEEHIYSIPLFYIYGVLFHHRISVLEKMSKQGDIASLAEC